MKVSKSKAVVRLFIISLISLVTLTGCLEDTYSRPAHEVGAVQKEPEQGGFFWLFRLRQRAFQFGASTVSKGVDAFRVR